MKRELCVGLALGAILLGALFISMVSLSEPELLPYAVVGVLVL